MIKKSIFLIISILILIGPQFIFAANDNTISTLPSFSKKEQAEVKESLKDLDQKIEDALDKNNAEEALVLAKEALNLATRIYGNNSLEKAQFLSSIGNIYFIQKKYEEAESPLKEALSIYETTVPQDSIELVNANKRLAGIYLLEKKYDLAKPLFEKALFVEEKLLGKDHQNNKATRKYLEIINEKLSVSSKEKQLVTPQELKSTGIKVSLTQRKISLAIFVILYFFISILGALKGAAGKAILFSTRKDLKISLFMTAGFLGLAVLLLFLKNSLQLAMLIISTFFLVNIIRSYYLNRKMKLVPFVVGFTRASIIVLIPILERVACVCMKEESFIQKEGENAEERTKRLDANPKKTVQFGRRLFDFVCNALVNGASVKLHWSYQQTDKTSERIKEVVKDDKTDKSQSPDFNYAARIASSDDLLIPALKIILETNQASPSILQRKLRLGHTQATKILNKMEKMGFVGPYEGNKPRKMFADSIRQYLNTVENKEAEA